MLKTEISSLLKKIVFCVFRASFAILRQFFSKCLVIFLQNCRQKLLILIHLSICIYSTLHICYG